MDFISLSSAVFASINGGLKLSSEVCLNSIFVFYKEILTYNLITQPPWSRSSSKSSSADRSSAFLSLCNQTCRINGFGKPFMWIYCKGFHLIWIKITFPFQGWSWFDQVSCKPQDKIPLPGFVQLCMSYPASAWKCMDHCQFSNWRGSTMLKKNFDQNLVFTWCSIERGRSSGWWKWIFNFKGNSPVQKRCSFCVFFACVSQVGKDKLTKF